jgi:2,4-dienoyl-CoA reductase-like NADH-dependent reductase (Old Yellow Enzyme family)
MCTYSAHDGVASTFHLVHLGRFALGGAGLVMVEATAVQERGRITYGDLGLWHDGQIDGLRPIAAFLKEQGAVPGLQLAHAGRKASMQRPWHGNGPIDARDVARGEPAWSIIGPVAEPHDAGWLLPRQMTTDDIAQLKADFRSAARRARTAGFEVLELHCAHGYLLHSFLSPKVNRRSDGYGGDLAGRMRLPLEVARELRGEWPPDKPVFVRVSAVDGASDGWSIDDTVALARELKTIGIDIVDCSSGGIGGATTSTLVARDYGFQLPFAEAVRRGAGIATMAVGLIVDARQAEAALRSGQADLIALARQFLETPNWALQAELILKAAATPAERFTNWPAPYGWWLQRRAAVLEKLGPWSGEH